MKNNTTIDTNDLLATIATYKASTAFTKEAMTPETFENRKLEGLGIAIAAYTEWSGYEILKIFHAALEDANYHELAEQVESMINIEKP